MQLILSPTEVQAMGLGKKKLTLDVPMKKGQKPNVVCCKGGTFGVVIGPCRLNVWVKPATGNGGDDAETL